MWDDFLWFLEYYTNKLCMPLPVHACYDQPILTFRIPIILFTPPLKLIFFES